MRATERTPIVKRFSHTTPAARARPDTFSSPSGSDRGRRNPSL